MITYDAEKLVGEYLRDALSEEVHVRATNPERRDDPWVRLSELSAQENPHVDHLTEHYFQADCFVGRGGGPKQVNELARDVRNALANMTELDGVVVTRTLINMGPRTLDVEMQPGRERKSVTATVWIHP